MSPATDNNYLRIDTHQHAIPTEYISALAEVGVHGSGKVPWPQWSAAETLELMDRHRLGGVVNSIASPGIHFGDIAHTRKTARDCNDAMARLVADHPGKFESLGVVPLPDAEAAAAETAYAVDTLGLPGIALLSHHGDKYLGHPDYNEFYAELDKRNAIAFVHPVRPPSEGMAEYCYPQGVVELVTDTTRAIGNMLFSGMLENYPNIRFVMSHAGGTMLSALIRFRRHANIPEVAEKVPAGIDTYLKRLYYDLAQATEPTTLRALTDYIAPDHIMLGSDFPFARIPGDQLLDDTITGLENFGLDDDTLRMIERDNALKMYPSLAA